MKNMKEANGKGLEDKEDLRGIFGFREKNPFKVKSEDELSARMRGMSLVDLQKMAIESGVSASGSIPSLKKKIIKAFKSYQSKNTIREKNNFQLGKTNDSFSAEQREAVRKINVTN